LTCFSLILVLKNSTWQERFSNHENLTMSGGVEVSGKMRWAIMQKEEYDTRRDSAGRSAFLSEPT
jgi:hypothetical protein